MMRMYDVIEDLRVCECVDKGGRLEVSLYAYLMESKEERVCVLLCVGAR